MVERVARAIWAARIQRCRDLGAPEDTIPWPWEQENETLHENVRVEARAAIEAMMEPNGVRCPFCGENGFDNIGLKIHLLNRWCGAYEQTPLADPILTGDSK